MAILPIPKTPGPLSHHPGARLRRNLANLRAIAAIVRDVALLFASDLTRRLHIDPKENP